MTKKAQGSNATLAEQSSPAESLDTVRDLLFGATTRGFEAQITALQSAQDRSVAEQGSQFGALQSLETKVDSLFNGLGDDLSTLTQHLAQTDAQIRADVEENLVALRQEIRLRLNKLEQEVREEVESRRAESVSRTSFVEVMQAAIEHIESAPDTSVGKARAS